MRRANEEKDYFELERRAYRRTLLLIVITTIALILIGRMVFLQSEREVKKIIEEQKMARSALELVKPRMRGLNPEGEIVWNISSESVSVDEDTDTVTFTNTVAEFFDEGEKSVDIKVGTLIYDQNSRNMEMFGGIDLVTSDGLIVETEKVRWFDFYQKFVFEEGAKIISEEGNVVRANYLQSNRTLDQMEAVGNVRIYIEEFTDEELIERHELTEEKVKLEEFKGVHITAEKAIYDREKQIIVATSRLYEKPFRITSPEGREIDISKYQAKPMPVYFKKKELEVFALHVEAHIKDKWVNAQGDIRGKILPSEPQPREDPALKVMRRKVTYFVSGDVEYFWGEDYARTTTETLVAQKDRFARGGRITYYGKYKEPGKAGLQRALFIEDGVQLWQKSGEWMFQENLLEGVKEKELENVLKQESDISARKIVVFLNRNDLHAAGMVSARQKDRETKADEIIYLDGEKKFVANGNAYFRDRDGQEFFGDQIIYFSDREYIEVNGAGTARIKIPEKYRKDVDEAIARVKGEKVEVENSESEPSKPEARSKESAKSSSSKENEPSTSEKTPPADDDTKEEAIEVKK